MPLPVLVARADQPVLLTQHIASTPTPSAECEAGLVIRGRLSEQRQEARSQDEKASISRCRPFLWCSSLPFSLTRSCFPLRRQVDPEGHHLQTREQQKEETAHCRVAALQQIQGTKTGSRSSRSSRSRSRSSSRSNRGINGGRGGKAGGPASS